MSTNDVRIKTSKRNFIVALILLLLTNVLMGVVLMGMSKNNLHEQINARMLDIANAAAAQLNGDELKTVTPLDKETDEYKRAYNTLHTFKDNIKLEYIYAVYPLEDGIFTFGIDPDEENPAEYGELIEMTDALRNAANGRPDVDDKPHSDEFGRFYSAYSPFFDSDGELVGIVGVDFDADYFDDKLNSKRAVAAIMTMVALCIGIVLSFIIMSQNRKSFEQMLKSIKTLDHEMNKLDSIIMETSIKKLDMLPAGDSEVLKTLASGEDTAFNSHTEYNEIHSSLDSVYQKLQKYLKYVDSEVYIDDTTGVKNKAAYKAKIAALDEEIAAGNAGFAVAFFDIDGIKSIYVHSGFEAGEKLMYECAKMLKKVFGKENVYHVTGDEFIAIIDVKSRFEIEEYLSEFDEELRKYNTEHKKEHLLSVSAGTATFDKEKNKDYRQIFVAAKTACDNNKAEHYNISAY